MDTLILLGATTASCVALFVLGAAYGTSVERYIVAKALAEYGKASAEATGLVQELLAGLKADYTRTYDEVVAELRKAL